MLLFVTLSIFRHEVHVFSHRSIAKCSLRIAIFIIPTIMIAIFEVFVYIYMYIFF